MKCSIAATSLSEVPQKVAKRTDKTEMAFISEQQLLSCRDWPSSKTLWQQRLDHQIMTQSYD